MAWSGKAPSKTCILWTCPCDSDENIETYGSINELFRKGEDYFRDLESKMILCMSTLDGVIMSTGGGVVLRPENTTY